MPPRLSAYQRDIRNQCDQLDEVLTSITLAYVPKDADEMALPAIEPIDCTFTQVTVAWGGEQTPIDLKTNQESAV